jgi:GMP synthase (glutamine-hydrolysing)
MTNKVIIIIQTGQAIPSALEKHGDFNDWFIKAMNIDRSQTKTFRVFDKLIFPKPDSNKIAGIIITGSASMVTQELEWSEKTIEWLKSFLHLDIPILGVCYGHQLLAKMLGGKVDWNPLGREIGRTSVQLDPHAQHDVLFKDLIKFDCQSLDFYSTHLQSVIEPPYDVTLLGVTNLDPCHCFRYKNHIWGLQFHPEFNSEIISEYIHARSDELIIEGIDPNARIGEINCQTFGIELLKKFKDICFSI